MYVYIYFMHFEHFLDLGAAVFLRNSTHSLRFPSIFADKEICQIFLQLCAANKCVNYSEIPQLM